MRRSTLDIRLGRALTIGWEFRHRSTGRLATVSQIHRADCQVELRDRRGARTCIPFAHLREQWDRIVPVIEEAKAA